MPVSWETFERYRQKGLDARRAMQWDSARLYLLEAARAMTQLASESTSDELRTGREQIPAPPLEPARDWDVAKKQNRRTPMASNARTRTESPPESDSDQGGAEKWIVKEKPTVRFSDVAGLDDAK